MERQYIFLHTGKGCFLSLLLLPLASSLALLVYWFFDHHIAGLGTGTIVLGFLIAFILQYDRGQAQKKRPPAKHSSSQPSIKQ